VNPVRRRRWTRVGGFWLLGFILVLSVSASAKESTTPSADELWRSYPLLHTRGPEVEATASAAPSAAPAGSGQPARPLAEAEGSDGGGMPGATLIALALALAGASAAAAAVWLRSHERAGAGLRRPEAGLGPPRRYGVAAAHARHDDASPASAAPSAGTPSAAPPDSGVPWTAELEWRHTGDGWRFRALARSPQGSRPAAIGESAPVESPPSGPRSVEAITRAVEELEASLLAAGWRPLPDSGRWYGKRFAWEPVRPAGRPHRRSPTEGSPAEKGSGFRLWMPAVAVASALAATAVVFGDVETPLRPAVVLWFVVCCPGLPVVALLELGDPTAEALITVGLSLSLATLVSTVLVLAGAPSPRLALGVLVGMTAASAVLDLVFIRTRATGGP